MSYSFSFFLFEGTMAPCLLVLVRMAQGLSVGGQLVGAMLFTVEGAPLHRQGMFGACCMGTAVFGTAAGSAVVPLLHLLPKKQVCQNSKVSSSLNLR